MRANGYSLKARSAVTLDDFRGVDYATSPMRVSRSRATDMQNLIIEDGIVRKRHGWREILRLSSGKINGIYDFSRAGVYIVHAGCDIYAVKKVGCGYTKLNGEGFEIADEPSYFYYYDDALYILCGTLLVYRDKEGDGSYSLEPAIGEDSAAYIPTTTISINATDGGDGKREFFESANLLTPYRKNMLIGGNGRYVLGGTFDLNKPVKISFEVKLATDNDNFSDYEVEIVFEKNDVKFNSIQLNGSDNPITATVIQKGYSPGYSVDVHYILDNGYGKVEDARADISTNLKDLSTCYLTLGKWPFAGGSDEGNVTVTFAAKDFNGAERIKKCRFGMLFGAEGNTNRLFLSGNPDEPNVDFYSEQDNFLYFPSGNISYFGTADVPITGYSRLSDSTMVVHKAENPTEATIYYRTGTNDYIYNANGNLGEIQTVFRVKAGTVGEGALTARGCVNLSGDTLFLSKNGLFSIVTAENLSIDEKYAKPRSVAVNPKLTKLDLSGAAVAVHRNRLYIATGGECYVADAAYKYIPEGAVDGAFSYEWWRWTNIPAVCFGIIDGELYFGTDDGRICSFDGEYSDRHVYTAEIGELSWNGNEENSIAFAADIGEVVKEGNKITFLSDVYASVGGAEAKSFKGQELYIYAPTESGFKVALKYTEGYELVTIQSVEGDLTARIEHGEAVCSYWLTPVMDMGTNVEGKTLEKLTISVEPECRGKIKFGYETRVAKRELSGRGLGAFSFEDFDFCDFNFETSFASSFTARVRERSFNYIRLRYASESEGACAVNNMTLTFKAGSANRGIK